MSCYVLRAYSETLFKLQRLWSVKTRMIFIWNWKGGSISAGLDLNWLPLKYKLNVPTTILTCLVLLVTGQLFCTTEIPEYIKTISKLGTCWHDLPPLVGAVESNMHQNWTERLHFQKKRNQRLHIFSTEVPYYWTCRHIQSHTLIS
jgi:hypothetical protein